MQVVIVTAGRYAGRKAVIVKVFDDGAKERKYGHCLIAGIDRYPKKITKSMSDKKQKARSTIKPFARFVNFNHILPTRYVVDLEVKKLALEEAEGKAGETVELNEKTLQDAAQRTTVLKGLKRSFEHGYSAVDEKKEGKAKTGEAFFYKRLRF